MLQAGRSKNAGGYRFGFQGQEADNKIGGLGQHLNYTFRNYDSWIIRFGAIDPLAAKYPHNSTYAFSENRVIDAVELEGLESAVINNDNSTFGIIWGTYGSLKASAYNLVHQSMIGLGYNLPDGQYYAGYTQEDGYGVYFNKYGNTDSSHPQPTTTGKVIGLGLDAANVVGFASPGKGQVAMFAKIGPVLRMARVSWSSTDDLIKKTMLFRKSKGLNTFDGQHMGSKSNVAIMEYLDEAGTPQYLIQMANKEGHAEKLLVDMLASSGINPEKVTRIYTELSPCLECEDALVGLKNVEITYSFEYTTEGRSEWKNKINDFYKYFNEQNKK
jgi:RHS repeat-associated protein